MARWHFHELTPRDKTREAMQGEFFATEAIRNAAEALVREAIQNSLDAGIKNDAGQPIETVRVRFHLATKEGAASPDACSEFFQGAWPHFLADGNGLTEKPNQSERCSFLVVEDFGTSGLTGDIEQWADEPNTTNAFYYFFRAEGRTGKGGDDRGRWGIGKYVFPRSSRARSFLGFTVRRDDNRKLLFGQAVLRTHKCNGKHYKPDGGFGESREDDGLLLPSEDYALIDRFRSTFSVSRGNDPGLSIVVPWIDTNEVSRDSLLEAVVRGYFYPILEGKLSVTVSDDTSEILVDSESLIEAVSTLGTKVADELLPLIELGIWASVRKPAEFLRFNTSPQRPSWSAPEVIPPDLILPLQRALDLGERIAIRVPINIRAHGRPDRTSHFDVFLVRDGTTEDRTTFIREGIIISDVHARRARGIRSIVVIEDKPLAALLGDAENPAHTEWQTKSSNFQGKYINGPSYLSYVIHCASSINSILSAQQREEDTTLLKDFFSLPAIEDAEAKRTRQKRKRRPKGINTTDPESIPEPRKRRYRLEKIPRGFRLCSGDPDADVPKMIEIRVAYDVRRGNALNKYNPEDFKLENANFVFEPPHHGVEIVERKENRMLVTVVSSNFQLSVVGFDTNRDLLVNVKVKEAPDAT